MATIEREILLDDESIQIEIEGNIIHVDHGIGHYEFWGSHGYDSQPGLEIDSISFKITSDIPKGLTEEVLKPIIDWYLTKNSEIIDNDLCQKESDFDQTFYPEFEPEADIHDRE
jgi:hypothetical protein